jgi:hypothetical protein
VPPENSGRFKAGLGHFCLHPFCLEHSSDVSSLQGVGFPEQMSGPLVPGVLFQVQPLVPPQLVLLVREAHAVGVPAHLLASSQAHPFAARHAELLVAEPQLAGEPAQAAVAADHLHPLPDRQVALVGLVSHPLGVPVQVKGVDHLHPPAGEHWSLLVMVVQLWGTPWHSPEAGYHWHVKLVTAEQASGVVAEAQSVGSPAQYC